MCFTIRRVKKFQRAVHLSGCINVFKEDVEHFDLSRVGRFLFDTNVFEENLWS